MKGKWKTYIFWIGVTEAVGAFSALLTRVGMKVYEMRVEKPPLTPPGIVFPIAWGILYALMGIGAARVRLEGEEPGRNRAINLFVTQLVVNFFWSIFFFNGQAFGFSLAWLLLLLALVVWMTLEFGRIDALAGKLQIPYILWLIFASYLNYGVWRLNG